MEGCGYILELIKRGRFSPRSGFVQQIVATDPNQPLTALGSYRCQRMVKSMPPISSWVLVWSAELKR